MRKWIGAALFGLALAGCGGVQVKPGVTLPTPLVDRIPARAAVYYPPELRERTHSEERRNVKYSIALGGASVATIDKGMDALFQDVARVADRDAVPALQPAARLGIVPWLDEYSFVTPQETASKDYSVTIRYRFELLDPRGATVDELTLTGFGNAPQAKLSASSPLTAATQLALRDLMAKFVVDFPQQDSVQRLLRGESLTPISRQEQQVEVALGVFEPAAAKPAEGAAAPAEPAPPADAAPTATPPAAAPPTAAPPAEAPPLGPLPPAAPPADPPAPAAPAAGAGEPPPGP